MGKNKNTDLSSFFKGEESVWARPEMNVTFRAEIMPGREREDRTYRIERVLPNGRVTLRGFPGEYRESAFEKINFLRDKAAKG
jgi:hypothetical protein